MRKIVFVVLTLLAAVLPSTKITAQTAAYDRPTVNFLLITHGDAYDAPTSEFFRAFPEVVKFYNNKLDMQYLKVGQLPRNSISPTAWQQVLTELKLQNVAKQEVAAWYRRTPDGSMSMDLIHRRGEFNATDETFLIATATKRGTDELKDLGRKLISKTYVVALDYTNIAYTANAETDGHSWKATVRAMVFKLKFSSEIENSIYDAWPDEQDTPEVRAEKSKRFDQIPFEMEFVQQVSVNATSAALITGKTRSNQSGLQAIATLTMGVRSKEALLKEMLQKGYKEIMEVLDKKVAAFKVLAGVWELDPIRAKIGKKEGLKTDQRYYVLEYEQDSKGKVKAVRKAVVRVGAGVADNRTVATGKSEASKFYQIAGRKVEKGMTLEQRNDAGIGMLMGSAVALNKDGNGQPQLQPQLRVEILPNRLINLGVWPGLYVYTEGIMEISNYELNSSLIDKYGFTDKSKDYTFLRGEFGLGRGFYFWRNFSLSPYVGMGWEMASLNKNFSVSAPYYKAGANLCLNVYYPFQLVGGVSGFFYGSPTLKEKEKDDSNSDSDADSKSKTFSNYDDIFSGRRGSNVSGFVGIRFNF